jgi:hypothetical protein
MARALDPLWISRPSRFAGISKRHARWWLAGLVLLMLVAATALITPGPPPVSHDPAAAAANLSDVMLYEHIVAGVRAGGNYYAVAADAQRQGDYPMRPFVTMRLPTLAIVQAMLPDLSVIVLIYGIAAATLWAWYVRLSDAFVRVAPRVIGLALLGCGGMICVRTDLIAFHEIWAGLLIALSLALWRENDWIPAIGIATCAMLVRETAALYAMVMAGMALWSGNRREAAGWGIGMAVLAVAVIAHFYGWSLVVKPGDSFGPGWSGLLGFGFFAKTITLLTALAPLPQLAGVILVALAIFGWASWRHPTALRAMAVLAAYALLISLFCRTDTYYWGLMVAPFILIGLAFAPDGLRDLIVAARDAPRIIVRRRALGDGL